MTATGHPKDFSKVPRLGAFPESAVLERLADGLVLRRATPADTEALVAFNTVAHADPPDFAPVPWVGAWTRDLVTGRHPRSQASDFTVVEDPATKRLVSTLCLIDHEFEYEEVRFPAGQVEVVATDPAYRGRRLVARQFEVVHRWSREREQALTVIDGIPWFYRQFDYELAIQGRQVRRSYLGPLRRGRRDDTLHVRSAGERDVELFTQLFARAAARSMLRCPRDEAFVHFELAGRDPESAVRSEFRVLEDASGRALAGFGHLWALLERRLLVSLCEVAPGVAWAELGETLLHAIADAGEEVGTRPVGKGTFEAASFTMPAPHPLYEVFPERTGEHDPGYAWWVRVPDLPGFLARIAPVLERRLAGSPFAGLDDRIALNFYDDGLRLVFERGRLRAAERWQPDTEHVGDAAIPGRRFLALLFGHRSFAESERFLPECLVWRQAVRPWLEVLFPRRPSQLWPTA